MKVRSYKPWSTKLCLSLVLDVLKVKVQGMGLFGVIKGYIGIMEKSMEAIFRVEV